jgi:hypothetical protein
MLSVEHIGPRADTALALLCPGCLQTVAVKVDGTESPPSNDAIITMPAVGPTLTSATPFGPTTGHATAASPEGASFTSFVFTATPSSGGSSVQATSAGPEARFRGLTPATEYAVTVVGVLADGSQVASQNTLTLKTPKPG